MRDDAAPLIEAAAVAEVRKRCAMRPPYLSDRPLAVEPDLWSEARTQLTEILRERGWPLCADEALWQRGVDNFMLCGVPIVVIDG